jgi:Putative beta-barrel porin-2, OmpL-like. bbp2
MRWHRKLLTLAALGALSAPQVAAADDVQNQLTQMQQRMNQLEDKLQATTDQLQATEKKSEQQQQVIDKAGLNTKTGSSKIAAFLDTLTIGGWASASYWYNANNPASGNLKNANTGGGSNPLNPDANSFSFEQLWFELERPISPEARAGFRADIAFGQVASILNQINAGTNCTTAANGSVTAPTLIQTAAGAAPTTPNLIRGAVVATSASAQNTARNTCNQSSSVYIDQAYVQYLIPWGDITFKAGQFGTLIGYEVPQAPYNWQLSRGLLFSLFQPINHVGILLSKTYDNGIDWGIGGVNGFGGPIGLNSQNSPDNNESKSILAHVGLTGDIGGVSVQALWGPEANGNDHQTRTTFDFIAHIKPWDWGPEVALNADYAILNGNLPGSSTAVINGVPVTMRPGAQYSPDAWGAALYARQAITDKLGISVRGEYVQDHNSFFCIQTGFFCTVVPTTAGGFVQVSPAFPGGFPNDNAKIYEFTGTVDYALTQQLITKLEVRWDALSNINGVSTHGSFPVGYINNQSNGLFNFNHQLVAGAEILYKF